MALLSVDASAFAEEVRACEISEAELNRLVTLSFQSFDQDAADGWRPLYEKKCFAEAAELLVGYMKHNPDSARLHYMLPFHAGQMFALSDNYSEAISFMRRGYSSIESKLIDWNAFVDANIAFLEHDRDLLKEMRDRINLQPAMTAEMNVPAWAVGRKMNLDVVYGFHACFKERYAVAYDLSCRPGIKGDDE